MKEKPDNEYMMMGGFMSARGRMGATKYIKKELDDPGYTEKTYHIARDLVDPKKRSCENTIRKVNLLE